MSSLETVKNNLVLVANLLIDKELHYVRSLITTELDDLSTLLVLLHGTVAGKVLLEGLANALNIKVVGKTGDGRDTFPAISLLDADVNLFGGGLASLVLGRILEGIEGIELHISAVKLRECSALLQYEVSFNAQMLRLGPTLLFGRGGMRDRHGGGSIGYEPDAASLCLAFRRPPPTARILTMLSRASCFAARTAAGAATRRNLSAAPVRKEVSKAERAQLRVARRERAAAFLQSQEGGAAAAAGSDAGAASAAAAAKGASSSSGGGLMLGPRVVYGVGLGLPTVLLFWGIYDEDSPPAKFSRAIGLTAKISSVTDEFARPAREKLIPDWSQVCSLTVLGCISYMHQVQLGILCATNIIWIDVFNRHLLASP